ncbi:MAG: ribbon-helix-helix domain-containing protein [Coriobacteriia bacterium]|nr:ribbon-helix-helix domain-containing protein [Coriobacteriia bacterium]
MARTAKTIGFSVPPELASEIERLASAEGRTKSELFREMVRVYRRERGLVALESGVTYAGERTRAPSLAESASADPSGAAGEPAGLPRPDVRLGHLKAFVESLPSLAPDDGAAFGEDLSRARDELERGEVVDPWRS